MRALGLAGAVGLLLVSSGAVTGMHAQAPGHERKTTPTAVRRIIVAAADYYATGVQWRDKVRDQTRKLLQHADGVAEERRMLEQRMMGNLARFGKRVAGKDSSYALPRFTKLRSSCAVDSTATTLCLADDYVAGRGIETIIERTYAHWRDTLYSELDKARDQTLLPVFGFLMEREGAGNKALFGKGGLIHRYADGQARNHRNSSAMGAGIVAGQLLVSSAATSASADTLLEMSVRLQDSAITDTTRISETRALQIQVQTIKTELRTLLEGTRTGVLQLEASARELQRQAKDARVLPAVQRMTTFARGAP